MQYDMSVVPKHFAQVVSSRRFYLDLDTAERPPLRVAMGGVEECSPDYACARSEFPFYCLELVSAGTGTLHLQSNECNIASGSLFAYGPGIAHQVSNAGSKTLVKYYVAFQGKDVPQRLKAAGLPPGSVAQVKSPDPVLGAFEQIVVNGCASTPHTREICANLLQALLPILADNLVPLGAQVFKGLETFRRAKQMLDEDVLRRWALKDLAEQCGVSSAYLCRLFQRFEHKTVRQYILAARMRQAARIMQEERLLVKQVAHRVNYSDPYQFSRVFKQVMGVSPRHFMDMVRRQP